MLILLLVLGFDRAGAGDEFRRLELENRFVKWRAPTWRTGAEVTYSFDRSQKGFDDAINCKSLVPLEGLLERSGIAQTDLDLSVRRAFDRRDEAANLRFTFVQDPDADWPVPEADPALSLEISAEALPVDSVEPVCVCSELSVSDPGEADWSASAVASPLALSFVALTSLAVESPLSDVAATDSLKTFLEDISAKLLMVRKQYLD